MHFINDVSKIMGKPKNNVRESLTEIKMPSIPEPRVMTPEMRRSFDFFEGIKNPSYRISMEILSEIRELKKLLVK